MFEEDGADAKRSKATRICSPVLERLIFGLVRYFYWQSLTWFVAYRTSFENQVHHRLE